MAVCGSKVGNGELQLKEGVFVICFIVYFFGNAGNCSPELEETESFHGGWWVEDEEDGGGGLQRFSGRGFIMEVKF